ncbi:hypothetical protein ACEW7V_01455 [Areca yellow leaf disease phytoplasma]
MASGLDPEKTRLFVQSEVTQHTYLGYLLNAILFFSELQRMISI